MKLKKIFSLFIVMLLVLAPTTYVFAKQGSWKGITYYTNKNEEDDLTGVMHPELNSTVYVDISDKSEWTQLANEYREEAAKNEKSGKSTEIGGAINEMRNEISSYGSVIDAFKPDINKGYGSLGEGTIDLIIGIRSIFTVLTVVLYLIMTGWNAALVGIPGLWDFMSSRAKGGNDPMGGGRGGKVFGASENTTRVMNGGGGAGGDMNSGEGGVSSLQKWLPEEAKRLIFIVVILVGLNSSLILMVFNFFAGIFNFG